MSVFDVASSKMADSDALPAEKLDILHNEGVLHDHDVNGHFSKEEMSSINHLTEEEKVMEKKLLRKIDSLIMPLVVLVYLMNYIGTTVMDILEALGEC